MAKVGGGAGRGGGPFVSARAARLAAGSGTLPNLPPDIGSKKRPIRGLLGQTSRLFYRKKGTWYYKAPESNWMPNVWLRGDSIFQRQLSISYAKR